MRFKKGDTVLLLGNAEGMDLKLSWPVKGIIASPLVGQREFYSVIFDTTDTKVINELEKRGHYAGQRWTYPVNLIRRSKICPVCEKAIETYSDRNLISEHNANNVLCYGSHSPLEL